MRKTNLTVNEPIVNVIWNTSFEMLSDLCRGKQPVILTDINIYGIYKNTLASFEMIVIEAGEQIKIQATVDDIIQQMLERNIDKSSILIGLGGGVITDIAGYVASVYKRGIELALVPTSILGMTDAAIGGKNGVNVGIYKNMVGTIYRPQFILYDLHFLKTLPKEEWINGFAEIIKHACIKDESMFTELEQHSLEYYMQNEEAVAGLIERNIAIKNKIVAEDEMETGERYLLNFGHTFGHAIENIYRLPHGHAVSIGMIIAAKISEQLGESVTGTAERIAKLSLQYGLPSSLEMEASKLLDAVGKDKKRAGSSINFVLLNGIGKGITRSMPLDKISELLTQIIK